MATLAITTTRRRAPLLKIGLWVAAVVGLATLLALLAVAVSGEHVPSQDRTILDRVAGWDVPGLAGFTSVSSDLTNNYPVVILGLSGVVVLWLLGLGRAALGFLLVGGIVGIVAFAGDMILGEAVGRARPLDMESGRSFPSGHVFGSTVLFGFWGFLAVYYGVKRAVLLPVLGVLLFMILSVGFARIHVQAHWPSDVAGGYLLGSLWLLILIPFFLRVQRMSWPSILSQFQDLTVESCEGCRVEKSIASRVVLNPDQGTATKTYRPPPVVRLLYWMAFQARFPYESNPEALHAAVYRRKIASLLTIHIFGKDLVAHVTSESCNHGKCSFVTEFIPGEKVGNDEEAGEYLGQVSKTFAEAGLSVWQVNPRNPHAHTNLIRNSDGDLVIIDLESAVVTLLPAKGQWQASLKRGSLPIFDDIDFGRLRQYVADNREALQMSLGADGVSELQKAADQGEEALRSWTGSEPRLWGRLIRGVYRLLDWKSLFTHLGHALYGADKASEAFLNRGIARWETERRLEHAEAASLRTRLSLGEVHEATHHLGAHLVLSVAIAIPIPGPRSLARFLWTLVFWGKFQLGRFRASPDGRARGANIHTPLVMVIALLPVLGSVAYMASRPLRTRTLVRLMFDQAAFEMPFGLYGRLRPARWLAPSPKLQPVSVPVERSRLT